MIRVLVGSLGVIRAKRAGQRSRSVHEDWVAWIPNEMDELFDATRNELECSSVILNITLDDALSLCKEGQYESARERAGIFSELLDRLAVRLCHVLRTVQEHGSHFGTLPNVSPLAPSNFRGASAQRVSRMSNLLARVLFHSRTRFFHKLDSLGEIIENLQKEAHTLALDIAEGSSSFPGRAWEQLEVLGYDLSTCTGETTVILKSFFCALPAEELEVFQRRLASPDPTLLGVDSRRVQSFHRE